VIIHTLRVKNIFARFSDKTQAICQKAFAPLAYQTYYFVIVWQVVVVQQVANNTHQKGGIFFVLVRQRIEKLIKFAMGLLEGNPKIEVKIYQLRNGFGAVAINDSVFSAYYYVT
jgi:hypothetical protein